MTRKESRRIKLRKQATTMRERGYKMVAGQWVREGSAKHHELSTRAKMKR
jgi:hypothetical protein